MAEDSEGKTSNSDPVQIKINNAGAPSLSYLVAFTIPTKPVSASSSSDTALPDNTPFIAAVPPSSPVVHLNTSNDVAPLAEGRDLIGEWAWSPVASIVGYGIKLSTSDLAGEFTEVGRPAASTVSSGLQKYSKILEVKPGDTVYGAMSFYGTGSSESVLSNADGATFLASHDASSPSDGKTISSLENLSWTALSGAKGYLYYVYDKNP